MNLKIGKKEFAVDRIIYVSPNGNDNNKDSIISSIFNQ